MRGNDERGFTLLETIVAVTITGLIVPAILAAMFVGMRTLDNTNKRIAGSNDTQLVAGYFTSDVASAEAVSTSGAISHAAPGLSPSTANNVLVGFWTLDNGTSLTAPDTMTEIWDRASTGPSAAARVTAAAADELLTDAGASGNRVADSAMGASSLTHSVTLAPALLQSITRRASSSGSTAGATTLSLTRPATTQNGDMLLAQVAVRGGSATTVSAPAGWTVVESRTTGTDIRSAVFSHTAGNADPSTWTWTFSALREAAGGIVGYSGVGSIGGHTSAVNPCGGLPSALVLDWTDRHHDASQDIAHEVSYAISTDGPETVLLRQHCTGTNRTPVDTQTLARALSATTAAFASCEPASCALTTAPVNVTLTLTEPPDLHSTVQRTYQLRGTTRTTQ